MYIFKLYIASNFHYCKVAWHFCSKKSRNKLEKLQEKGLRIVCEDNESSYEDLLLKCNMKSLHVERLQTILLEAYNARKGTGPRFISKLFKSKSTTYDLINKDQLAVVNKRTVSHGLRSFSYLGATLWNRLPNHIKELDVIQFKKEIRNLDTVRLEKMYSF